MLATPSRKRALRQLIDPWRFELQDRRLARGNFQRPRQEFIAVEGSLRHLIGGPVEDRAGGHVIRHAADRHDRPRIEKAALVDRERRRFAGVGDCDRLLAMMTGLRLRGGGSQRRRERRGGENDQTRCAMREGHIHFLYCHAYNAPATLWFTAKAKKIAATALRNNILQK